MLEALLVSFALVAVAAIVELVRRSWQLDDCDLNRRAIDARRRVRDPSNGASEEAFVELEALSKRLDWSNFWALGWRFALLLFAVIWLANYWRP